MPRLAVTSLPPLEVVRPTLGSAASNASVTPSSLPPFSSQPKTPSFSDVQPRVGPVRNSVSSEPSLQLWSSAPQLPRLMAARFSILAVALVALWESRAPLLLGQSCHALLLVTQVCGLSASSVSLTQNCNGGYSSLMKKLFRICSLASSARPKNLIPLLFDVFLANRRREPFELGHLDNEHEDLGQRDRDLPFLHSVGSAASGKFAVAGVISHS